MEMETGLNLAEKESEEGNQDNDFSRSKRFSILKTSKGLSEDNTATIRSSRRVSFSSNYIKAFMSDDDKNTIWDTTVEEVISNNESTISSNNICQGNDDFNTSVFFNSSDMDMELTATDSNVLMDQKENMPVKETILTPYLEKKNLFMTATDKENIPVPPRVPLLTKKPVTPNKPIQVIGKENDRDIMLRRENIDDLVMQKENIPVNTVGSNYEPVSEEKNMPASILRKKLQVGLTDQEYRSLVVLHKENKFLLSMEKIDNPLVVKENVSPSQDAIISPVILKNEDEMEFTYLSSTLTSNEGEMEFTCKHSTLKAKDDMELTGKHSILNRNEEDMVFTCKNPILKQNEDEMEFTCKNPILKSNEDEMEFTCKNPILKSNEDEMEFTCKNPILKSKVDMEFTGKHSILNRSAHEMEFTCRNPILKSNEEEMEFTCKNPILNQNEESMEFTCKNPIFKKNEFEMDFPCSNLILKSNEEDMEFTCKNQILKQNEEDMEFTCKNQILKQNEVEMEFTCRNPTLISRDDMTPTDKHSILNRNGEEMEFTCKNPILQQNEEEMEFTCKNPILKQDEDEMEFTCKNPILKRSEPEIESACKKPKLSLPYSERKTGACHLQDSKLVDDTIDRDFLHKANDKTISNISNMTISDMITFVPEKVPTTLKYNFYFENREVSDDFPEARVPESHIIESSDKGIDKLNNSESQKFSSGNTVSASSNVLQEDIDNRPTMNSSTLSNLSKNISLFPKEVPSFVDQCLTSEIIVKVPIISSPERTINLSCEPLKKHPVANSTLKNEYHIPKENIAQVENEIECRHYQNSSKKDLSLSVSNIGSANTSLGNTTDFLLKNISTLSQGMYDTQQLLRAASGMNKSKNYDETSVENKIPKAGINTTYLVGSMENNSDKELKRIEIEEDCIEQRDTDIFSKCQNSEKSDMYSIDKEVSIDLIDSSAEDLPRAGSVNNVCNNESRQIPQERQTSDDDVTENSKAEERKEDSSTHQSSNPEDYVPWNKIAFLEAREKRMKHFENKLQELKIPELNLDNRVTEMCEKLRNLTKKYSKYSLNFEEKYLAFQKYRNKILEECVLNYGMEKVNDVEDENSNPEEIEEEAPSILQEIMIKSKMSDCNWKFVKAEDGIAYFTTLFGTLEFSSKYQSYDEIITNLKTVSFLTEKSPPIMHLLQKELLHALTRERIINCIGHCNNILSLLDYIQMGMEKIRTQYATWKEIERSHKLSLTTDYKASFVIINVDLIVKWIFSVDLSSLEHISKDSVDVCASVGIVDKKHVLKLVEECPKGIDFIHSYINKIETYMGTLFRMR